ncbi:CHAD domain-containing protein [Hyphomonas sp.]|uniref:CHAD domain-containing protein n=1 Tax=Hyphomonas sp. TaxID=87 RepID=UPI00391DCE6E
MGYRFKAGEKSITEGVRRIAAAEFAQIRLSLSDPSLPLARKVHEGRKATKRLRALLRLVSPVFPGAAEEIAALRTAASELSALRDTGALLEAIDGLDLPGDLSGTLRTALAARPAASAAAHRRLLAAFAAAMDAAAQRAESWTLDKEGWNALAPGLTRAHRRLRKARAEARRAGHEDPVHDLRKRAKDHWYQTLLLRGAFPDVMNGYAEAGEHLCEDLGRWRDLGLLETAVGGLSARKLAAADAETVLTVIASARRRALRRAFRTAGRLLAESPDAYAARLKAWWTPRR